MNRMKKFPRRSIGALAAGLVALAAGQAQAGGCSSFSFGLSIGGGGYRHYDRSHFSYGYSSCGPRYVSRRSYDCGPTYYHGPTYYCGPTYIEPCRPAYVHYPGRSSVVIDYSYREPVYVSSRGRYDDDDSYTVVDDRAQQTSDSGRTAVRTVTASRPSSRDQFRDWQAAAPAATEPSTPTYLAGSGDRAEPLDAPVAAVESVDSAASAVSSTDDPWSLLAGGDYSRAARIFGAKSSASKSDAPSRVGYALSAAGMGRWEAASWAMRRAFAADAEAAGFIPLEGTLSHRVDELAKAARERAKVRPSGDAHFMVAALEYLRHDEAAAQAAAREAMAIGDRQPSTEKLLTLVDTTTR